MPLFNYYLSFFVGFCHVDEFINLFLFFLQSLVAFPKLKRQVILYFPEVQSPKDFDENTAFWVNQEFALV